MFRGTCRVTESCTLERGRRQLVEDELEGISLQRRNRTEETLRMGQVTLGSWGGAELRPLL